MLYLYVFAAVAGGLLVLVSLLGAGQNDAHGDGDAHGDAHGDAASHGEAGVYADAGGDAHAGGQGDGADGDGHGVSDAHGHGHDIGAPGGQHAHASDGMDSGVPTALLWLLSVQIWTYLLAFGGTTGLLLRTVAKVPEPLCGLSALGVGLTTAFVARSVMRKMSVTQEPGTLSEEKMVGSRAKVLIPAPAGGLGKVRLDVAGHVVDLVAKAADGGPLVDGADVTILDIRSGQAEVSVLRDEEAKKEMVGGAPRNLRSIEEKGR